MSNYDAWQKNFDNWRQGIGSYWLTYICETKEEYQEAREFVSKLTLTNPEYEYFFRKEGMRIKDYLNDKSYELTIVPDARLID